MNGTPPASSTCASALTAMGIAELCWMLVRKDVVSVGEQEGAGERGPE